MLLAVDRRVHSVRGKGPSKVLYPGSDAWCATRTRRRVALKL